MYDVERGWPPPVEDRIMELEAFLADSVVGAEGKLYVQGAGWNIVNASALPFRLSRVGIGMIVRIPYTATNQPHTFEVYLRDGDGGELPLGEAPPGIDSPDGKVRRLGGEFNVGRPPTIQAGDEQLVVLAINMDGLTFERADRYEFVIEIDGSEEKHLGFRVIQVPQLAPIVR